MINEKNGHLVASPPSEDDAIWDEDIVSAYIDGLFQDPSFLAVAQSRIPEVSEEAMSFDFERMTKNFDRLMASWAKADNL
jgi:hypothetical protein